MIQKPMHYNEYSITTIDHLRQVQLMILKDFIEICEKNNIEYYSYGGTTLGAIRHQGYIPWDDDIDIIMFRDEYEKFVEIFDKIKSDKYYLLSSEKNEDYFYFLTKFCLKNTEFKQSWSRNTEFKLGINIDIFILEYLPNNKIKRIIYLKKAKLIEKICAVFIVALNKNYPSKNKKIITEVGIRFLNFFRITPKKVKKYYKNLVRTNNKNNSTHVFENGAVCYNEPLPKNIFKPPKKAKFEDIEINIPNDVDTYLTIIYGDYMKLPPEEDRIVHEHDYIDFGPY